MSETTPNDSPVPPGSQSASLPAGAREALEAIYRRVDREIESTGVACWLRGRCCDFDTSEHVLFASSVELAHVREKHPERFEPGGTLCPFWKDGLCVERERRPLGCRTYHCDRGYRGRVEAIHERYHGEIRAFAERFDLAYLYEPFVPALRRTPVDRHE